MAAVSIVLLGLTIALTCALFKKLKYLNAQNGNVYGNLNQPSDSMQMEQLNN